MSTSMGERPGRQHRPVRRSVTSPRSLAVALLAGCVATVTACAGAGPARTGPADLTLAGSSSLSSAPDLSDASKQLAGVGSTPALPTAEDAPGPGPDVAPAEPVAATDSTSSSGRLAAGSTGSTGARSTPPTTAPPATAARSTTAVPTAPAAPAAPASTTGTAPAAAAGPPPPAVTTTTVTSSAPTTRRSPVLKSVAPSSTTGTGSLLYGPGIPTPAEAEVIRLVNVERTAAGCPALAVNTLLVQVARAHSLEMTAPGGFRHNSPDGRTPFQRLTAVGYDYSVATENIAAGQPTANAVMSAWMASDEHKANMLDCRLTQIGVGLVNKPGSQYGTYWTQDIASPM